MQSLFKKAVCTAAAVAITAQLGGYQAVALPADIADTSLQQEKTEITDVSRLEISEANIPETLDVEQIKSEGFVARLKSEEASLSEIVLEKEDGTRALYLFDRSVKFTDDKGNIIDKSNKAVFADGKFKAESNDIEVTLPQSISAGITAKNDGFHISMRPVATANTRILSAGSISGENSVLYKDVFDDFTDIKYTFTYEGVKEDIILEKYSGKNEFVFEVTTGGLTLFDEKGTLLLADEKGEVQASLGEVIVFSADNKNNTCGEFEIEEKVDNSVYTVTVKVDTEYLTSPDTVYPVTIDPTVTFNTDSYIQDMQVFKGVDGSGDTETSSGLSGVSRVGWTDWGACRTLLRLENFSFANNGITDQWQISKVYVQIRDLMCQDYTTPIQCAQFNGSTWNENQQITWNSLNASSVGMTAPTNTPGSTSTYNIVGCGKGNGVQPDGETPRTDLKYWFGWDITNIFINWFNEYKATDSYSNMNRGLIFKTLNTMLEASTNANGMKTFGSVNRSDGYAPYFCIEYKSNGYRDAEEWKNCPNANCFAYAFDIEPFDGEDVNFMYPIKPEDWTRWYQANTYEEILDIVQEYLEDWLEKNFDGEYRIAENGYTENLEMGEWLVCLRTDNNSDYHFWYRASNGDWYNKHGEADSVCVGINVIDPGNPGTTNGWSKGGTSTAVNYGSEAVYYVVKHNQ